MILPAVVDQPGQHFWQYRFFIVNGDDDRKVLAHANSPLNKLISEVSQNQPFMRRASTSLAGQLPQCNPQSPAGFE